MSEGYTLIQHRRGAPGLRLGLGPGLRPAASLAQLARLFQSGSFWAQGRSPGSLRRMLRGSDAVVSAWREDVLVGFGRATSDGVYRAVLWDVVVAPAETGRGLGTRVVETLLATPCVAAAERVYLMTTNGQGFYRKLGFRTIESQKLMRRDQSSG